MCTKFYYLIDDSICQQYLIDDEMICDLITFLQLLLFLYNKLGNLYKKHFKILQMRKNLSKQYSKRPWKTPSPSTHTNNMKSPIYLRGGLLRMDSIKQIKQDNNAQNRSRPRVHNFKSQLLQIKQQANKTDAQTLRANYDYVLKNDTKHKNDEIQSYNSYFSKSSSFYQTIAKNYTNRNSIRETGFRRDQSETNKSQSKIQESIKKYIDENLKLMQAIKDSQQNYNKLLQRNNALQSQIMQYRAQLQIHKIKEEDLKYRENILTIQIQKLNDLLETNASDLNYANMEIYKMKQQIYQLTLVSKKNENQTVKTTTNDEKCGSVKDKVDGSHICQLCKRYQKSIASLNIQLQNKMFQAGRRENRISSLCVQLQKLEQELRILQKPKAIIKKISHSLQQANLLIVQNNIKEINKKYAHIYSSK